MRGIASAFIANSRNTGSSLTGIEPNLTICLQVKIAGVKAN